MNRVKTRAEVKVYEVAGKEMPAGSHEPLAVETHWNNGEKVNISFRDGITITVLADDLQLAIERCSK
jgi:hypothetical protein